MTAAAAVMRLYLQNVTGIGDSPMGEATAKRDAVREEGIDNIEDLADFEEGDIKILCALVRKSIGIIEDLNDNTRRITNPGQSILMTVEKRLKLACYGLGIYQLLQRSITPESLSWARLKEFDNHIHTI